MFSHFFEKLNIIPYALLHCSVHPWWFYNDLHLQGLNRVFNTFCPMCVFIQYIYAIFSPRMQAQRCIDSQLNICIWFFINIFQSKKILHTQSVNIHSDTQILCLRQNTKVTIVCYTDANILDFSLYYNCIFL